MRLFILFFLFIGYNSMSQTEEQSYSVLKTLEDVQIREYDPVIYATVSTDNERSLFRILAGDRKSTRLNSSHSQQSRMPSSA